MYGHVIPQSRQTKQESGWLLRCKEVATTAAFVSRLKKLRATGLASPEVRRWKMVEKKKGRKKNLRTRGLLKLRMTRIYVDRLVDTTMPFA